MSEAVGMMTIGFAMAGLFGWLVYRGFSTGKMWVKNRDFARRASEPIYFWIAAGLNIVMGGLGLWVIEIGWSRLLT